MIGHGHLGNRKAAQTVAAVLGIGPEAVAANRGGAKRPEEFDVHFGTVAERSGGSRISDDAERFLRKGDPGTSHALCLHAVAVLEVPVIGQSQSGQEQPDQRSGTTPPVSTRSLRDGSGDG